MPAIRRRLTAAVLIVLGSLIVVSAALFSSASGLSQALIILGALLPPAGLILGRKTVTPVIGTTARAGSPDTLSDDRDAFEAWREQVSESLQQQAEQLEQQRQQLNQKTLRYREFLEYPNDDSIEASSDDSPSELSERDREVNRILEQEAARVYEKIRADGYRVDGQLDVDTIRQETLEIIQRVARVYSPDSANPLLETSFDQLARAASRVCLQALVLVEQLPLDVQHYTMAELYNYVRTAVNAWGTWQSVAPWMTRVSRGLYAGRLAAGASPVTLGAWWIAAELGRHGTKKLVNHYVDQQAVAFFNSAVRLVGNEVACVYGPGIRQRDPAWVYGAELTELLHRFPVSRDSLQAGLREITGLPLRSEYDRIYLYRCLAEHKACGLRLADPAILTRDEREGIAQRLEQFFQTSIHGATEKQVQSWQDSVEEHLDLRLSLSGTVPAASSADALDAVWSIQTFLTGAGGQSADDAMNTVRSSQLYTRLDAGQRDELQQRIEAGAAPSFEPPDMDPADPLTEDFLDELITSCVRAPLFDPSLETLLVETGRFFRRGADEMRQAIRNSWKQRLDTRTLPDAPLPKKVNVPARRLLQLMNSGESVAAIYHDVRVEPTGRLNMDPDELCLAVLQHTDGRRLLLLRQSVEPSLLWESADNFTTERLSGIINDDCAITGGKWTDGAGAGQIIISGRFATSYQTWFAPLQ